MAISAATCWEVRTTGNDLNGGGFVAGATGTDRSQSNSAFVTIDNATITATSSGSTVTFTAGYTPTAADVGNVYMDSGTNGSTPGPYDITATTSTTWTVRGTIGTSTGLVGRMGGALATVNKLASAMVASNKAFVQAGTYTTTSTITFGAASVVPSATATPTSLIGYNATRGDILPGSALAMPVVRLSTNSNLIAASLSGQGWYVANMSFDCNSLGNSLAVAAQKYTVLFNCKLANFKFAGVQFGDSWCAAVACEFTGGASGAKAIFALGAATAILSCYIHDNACTAVSSSTTPMLTIRGNLIANNAGASTDGITVSDSGEAIIEGNTIYGSGRDGIRIGSTSGPAFPTVIRGNILASNGGYGVNFAAAGWGASPLWDGNAYYNNTSGARNDMDDAGAANKANGVAPYANALDVILTADPFVNAAAGNFALNTTAGGGAACRGHGVPTSWPGNSATASYPDMGAVQSQSAGTTTYVVAKTIVNHLYDSPEP